MAAAERLSEKTLVRLSEYSGTERIALLPASPICDTLGFEESVRLSHVALQEVMTV
jgi:hypothetical protein